MYLANYTRPDIDFFVNLLARYSSAPTRRHWNGIQHILRYLSGTTDMGLFYSNKSKEKLLGYADAGYLSDPHKARSQTGYVFNYNGTSILWRSVKQTWWLHHQIIQKLLQFTKLVMNACGLDRRSTIFKNHVGSPMSKTSQQYYLKTMLHALHKSKEVTSKEIEPSTFHQNFSIHMSFRRMVKLMSSKYDQVIIWKIYSQRHYRLQRSRN